MTSAHILYIPTIFLLGFLTGSLVGKGSASTNSEARSGISGRTLLGSFVIFVVVFVGTHFFEIPRSSKAVTNALNGQQIFDKKPSFGSEEVYARIAKFPDSGRELYKQFTYTIDILFPLTLFTFLILLAQFTNKRVSFPRTIRLILITIPILWLTMDFFENAIIFNLLNKYPAKNFLLAGSLGYLTITKFSLLLLSILAPTILIAYHNIRKRVNANA
jgi:hypothetical protein